MIPLTGWGRFPSVITELYGADNLGDIPDYLQRAKGVISRGNGRAYGDAAVGVHQTLDMRSCNRAIAFNEDSGFLTIEAGAILGDIIANWLPRGFFPYVVPGTRLVTVGGAIAADVHGKNHHKEGGFGRWLDSISLLTGDGQTLVASRRENSEIFYATIGGMGLTGTILSATFRLRPVKNGWIRQKTLVAANLEEAMALLESFDESTYSVAWIDATATAKNLGRSLVYLGEHCENVPLHKKSAFPVARSIPVGVFCDAPNFALNRRAIKLFNEMYFRYGSLHKDRYKYLNSNSYFFPLDGIANWNRLYGARGFVQYQCVLPQEKSASALSEILEATVRRGNGSFLAVLKKLGAGEGWLSFPLPGYTLALDFPVSVDVFSFLDDLDRLVLKAGGRLYLAKDSRQSRATFAAGYPLLEQFRNLCRHLDPKSRIGSHLSQRLGI